MMHSTAGHPAARPFASALVVTLAKSHNKNGKEVLWSVWIDGKSTAFGMAEAIEFAWQFVDDVNGVDVWTHTPAYVHYLLDGISSSDLLPHSN